MFNFNRESSQLVFLNADNNVNIVVALLSGLSVISTHILF